MDMGIESPLIACRCPDSCLCETVMSGLPVALSRLQRHHLEMLSSVLDGAHSHFVSSLGVIDLQVNQLADPGPSKPSDRTSSKEASPGLNVHCVSW